MTEQQRSTPHARAVQRALDLRDSRPVERIDDDDRNDRDWRDSRGDRDGSFGALRHGGRDWDGRRDWRHDRGGSRHWDRGWDRPSWSWGFSIGFSGSWSFGASYNWHSSYRPSWYGWHPRRYHYQPCDWYWDGYRPRVSILVGRPLWCSPRYYHDPCCWENCYSPYHSAWCSQAVVTTTYVPVYVNDSYGTIGSVETFTNDYVPATSPAYPVASATPAPTYQPAGPVGVATTYRATTSAGVMDWSDTPARIMEAINTAPEGQRAATAGRFLGRSVAGAWELIFERAQPAGSRTMLLCTARGASTTPSPVVALVVDTAVDLKPGAVLVATGRLAEISLNDPEAPNGVLVLEDAKLAL